MKAFWWFRENAIAGMGRPGFNAVQWFDLSLDEALLLGWIGKSHGSGDLLSFRTYIRNHARRIHASYNVDEQSTDRLLKIFEDESRITILADRLSERTQVLEEFKISDKVIRFKLNGRRLNKEIEFLKQNGIARLVSFTERHDDKHILQKHFDVHHLGIEDLGAPTLQQVSELAVLIQSSIKKTERIAVHCLAGIGRTSTMLMASHILIGERLKDLEMRLKMQNPTFVLSDSQRSFLRTLSA